MSDAPTRPEARAAQPPAAGAGAAHSARVYDYILGGTDNHPADRAAAERMLRGYPGLRTSMRQNRAFMHRAVRYAAEQGLDQFLDIGTGIPTSPNVHEVAQAVTPAARVVYVDRDPVVFAHAAVRLAGTPEGRVAWLLADMADPAAVLAAPEVAGTLDLARPVALSLIGVLQFVPGKEDAYALVRRYLDRLAPGSMLTITTATSDTAPARAGSAAEQFRRSGIPVRDSTRADVEPYFHGLDLADPGVTLVHRWRPEPGTQGTVRDDEVAMYAGVARKR